MTRIVAGLAGGTRLVTPPGAATRPTSERVREALFARLDHEGVLPGARVLDLYAGSGALGLEAASRGAAHVVLVDAAPRALVAARRNAQQVRAAAGASARGEPPIVDVRPGSVGAFLAGPGSQPFDVVFFDPPYDVPEDRLASDLTALGARGWLAAAAVVVVERSSRSPEPAWPQGLERTGERRYGETRLWFAEAPSGPEDPPGDPPGDQVTTGANDR
ncbi:MAG: 16S rRNA (guanine(966)-N(2))-methyltransferase RsmD [Dermatophilaceae bacterium]